MAKKENDSISAKAVSDVPQSLSDSSGFLAPARINEPKSTPHDNAPKAIGIVVKPIIIIFANFTMIKN